MSELDSSVKELRLQTDRERELERSNADMQQKIQQLERKNIELQKKLQLQKQKLSAASSSELYM